MRKGDIACNKQSLLFSQCFLSYIALIFHFKMHFNPLPDNKIFDWSKFKQIADSIFKMKNKYHILHVYGI